MAVNFFQVSAEGHTGKESIDNVFYFTSSDGTALDPSVGDLITVATAVAAKYATAYLAALPSDYVLDGWRCKGYASDGEVSTSIPQFVASGASGSGSAVRDGNAHAALARCALGLYHGIVEGASKLRRGYFALGPLLNTMVDNDGTLLTGAMSSWGTFRNLLDDPINAFATNDLLPIKVSHTADKVVVAQLTAWRPILSLTWGVQTLLRKSRNNIR